MAQYINPQFADQLKNDPRYALAQSMLAQGSNTAPVQGGGIEALARVFQGGLGGYTAGKVKEEYTDKQKGTADDLARALGQIGGQDATTQTLSDGTVVNWDAQAPNMQAGLSTLASNPALADTATSLQLEQIKAKQASAADLAKLQLAQTLKASEPMTPYQQAELGYKEREQTTDAFGNTIPKYRQSGASGLTGADIAGGGQMSATTNSTSSAPVDVTNKTSGINPNIANSPKFQMTLAEKQLDKNLAQPKSLAGYRSAVATNDNVISNIDKALGQVNGWTAGMGSTLSNIPGTDAKNLDSTLATIRANIGFDALQEMRNNSPTGGALGAISDSEGRKLDALKANIEASQSPDQLRENLNALKSQVQASKERFREAYKADYGAYPDGDNMSAPPKLTDKSAFDALPSGSRFIAPDGTERIKP